MSCDKKDLVLVQLVGLKLRPYPRQRLGYNKISNSFKNLDNSLNWVVDPIFICLLAFILGESKKIFWRKFSNLLFHLKFLELASIPYNFHFLIFFYLRHLKNVTSILNSRKNSQRNRTSPINSILCTKTKETRATLKICAHVKVHRLKMT